MRGGEAEMVAGGYFVVRPYGREDSMSDLLPPVVFSASPCITDIGPDFTWAEPLPNDWKWRAEAESLGIAAERRNDVIEWLNEALAGGSIRWPNVLTSPDAARTFAAEFDLRCGELALLGIGLTSPHLAAFLEEEDASGIRQVLEQRVPMAAGGQLLGYEVLGLEGDGTFHSWICNSLESDAATELEIRPNENGFLDTLTDAERVAQWAIEGERGEPVFWQPWLVARYSWS